MLYVLVAVHFVADFVCQTSWQALNKSRSWHALVRHVVIYTLVLFGIMLIASSSDVGTIEAWCLINGAAHGVTDAFTSRLNTWLFHRFSDDPAHHWFFVGVGFDQLIHYVTLFGTAQWMGLL